MNSSVNVSEIMNQMTGKPHENDTMAEAPFLEDYPDGYIPSLNESMIQLAGVRKNASLQYIAFNKTVPYYRNVSGNRLIIFIKRVIRKLVFFCVKPPIDDQNGINDRILRILEIQDREISMLQSEIIELKKMVNNSEKEDL